MATLQYRIQATQQATVMMLGDALVQAAAGANAETARTIIELARVFERGLAPGQRQQAHASIGRLAQRSVLASYAQTVKGSKRTGPYRLQARNPRNRRYAGGALKRVLAASDFFVATPEGLGFINVARLEREARHWARLNAGAGALGRGSRRRFEVRWSNLVIASLGLDMSASEAFVIPRGYWFNAGEGQPVAPGGTGPDAFYPVGEGPRSRARTRTVGVDPDGRRVGIPFQRRRITRGIRARNFLDAGVARIARELPVTYDRLYRDLYRQGIAQVRPGHVANIRVRTSTRWR